MIHPLNVFLFAFALKAAQAPQSVPADYLIGPDDVVTVTVTGAPQFSGDFLVPPNGIVTFPAVGVVKVQGLSLPALTQLLTNGLKKRLINPEVAVNLKLLHADRVSIIGDVKLPGVYPIHAGTRILDVLSEAGALLPGSLPSDYQVNLVRGADRMVFPLKDVLEGDPTNNVVVKPGDTISLTSASLVAVNVIGAVKLPGLYRLRPDMSGPLEALAQAGGPLDVASLSSVRIRHLNGQEVTVDLRSPLSKGGSTLATPRLEYGDLVIVPEGQDKFAVLGAAGGGVFPLPDGRPTTLADALATAKGSDPRTARFRYIGIIRSDGVKTQRFVYDFGKFVQKGDWTQNPEIHAGDVVYVPPSAAASSTDIFRGLAELVAVAALLIRN